MKGEGWFGLNRVTGRSIMPFGAILGSKCYTDIKWPYFAFASIVKWLRQRLKKWSICQYPEVAVVLSHSTSMANLISFCPDKPPPPNSDSANNKSWGPWQGLRKEQIGLHWGWAGSLQQRWPLIAIFRSQTSPSLQQTKQWAKSL